MKLFVNLKQKCLFLETATLRKTQEDLQSQRPLHAIKTGGFLCQQETKYEEGQRKAEKKEDKRFPDRADGKHSRLMYLWKSSRNAYRRCT